MMNENEVGTMRAVRRTQTMLIVAWSFMAVDIIALLLLLAARQP